MTGNDLLDGSDGRGYHDGVTDGQVWTDLGAELRAIRQRAGWRSTNALAKARSQRPTQKTMDAIERGEAGSVRSLGEYCQALGVRLADVLAVIIARPDAVTPDAMRLARTFDAMPDAARLAVSALAEALAAPPGQAPPSAVAKTGRGKARPSSDGERGKRT